jgi:hypothetical protein
MEALRVLPKLISTMGAALVGNWLGGQIRSTLTGQPVQSIRFEYTTTDGKVVRNIPVVTKFYPALLFAWLGKPRWLYAFLGGCVTGALVDECHERTLWRFLLQAGLGPA